MSKHEEKEVAVVSYKDTLNLPHTDFPIRAQAHIFDKEILERWKKERLYAVAFDHNKGKEQFFLPDGPPYSNGDIHLGHAYNKILKDIVTKSERMSGKRVIFFPVWDCHGLPIELKVTEETKLDKNDPVALKKACRVYAQKWVDIQKEQFENLGLLMQWDKYCTTMDPIYEAQTLRAFGIMFDKGYIARKQKTVPWCMNCQTVLANAEIEYEERKDPSIYVQFPFASEIVSRLFPQAFGKQVSLLIWTTTPWTLSLNRAVVLKPGAIYQLVEINEKLVIIGKSLVGSVVDVMGVIPKIITEFNAEYLINQKVNHPFIKDLQVPVIGDAFVSLEDGTACVHSAPGCGPEDYEIGIKNGLEIYSPLTIDGRYTDEIMPAELRGMLVTDGQWAVLKILAELDLLLFKQTIRHSYPHCWRCHNGLIFRATKQWFCDLSQHNLRERALQAISEMRMIPETGRNRLSATVSGRLEWCLSRQRVWGVPIPAVSCGDCNDVYISTKLIEFVAKGVEIYGIEYWDTVSVETLIPAGICQKCKSKNIKKESDILDVWFDSGVSHFATMSEMLEANDIIYPADMYLEGKDQHRGWFQSSLLTSLALHDKPAMKEILTHGFTVDEKGRKMSKSIGNVVSPADIIKEIGNDGLRLWVASNDYDSDPVVSNNLMNNVAEVHRKIRNTCRGLLMNLYDFNFKKDAISIGKMLTVDQYAVCQLHDLNESIKQAYKDRKTTAVFHELADYCVKEISSFYLDIVKDRLYVEKFDSLERRSAQTACYYIVDTLTKLMAPVLSFTAELIADAYQVDKKRSIHLQDFESLAWVHDSLFEQSNDDIKAFTESFDAMRSMRSLVLKSLEDLRTQGIIKHSLDAAVQLHITKNYKHYQQIANLFDRIRQQGRSVDLFLKEYFIISQIHLADTSGDMLQVAPEVFVKILKAQGEKCARCWQWEQDDLFHVEKQLCQRCLRSL